MSIRFSDLVKPFRGDGEQNVEVWLDKLELVARLQKVPELADFLPLFLDGAAFAVYQQFSVETKSSFVALKRELLGAFSADKFKAFESFRHRRFMSGEAVDVYLADLRRLLALVSDSVCDEMLLCAFVTGLPEQVSRQLRALSNIEGLLLSDVVKKARLLLAESSSSVCAAVVSSNGTRPLTRNRFQGYCYRCKRRGHKEQDCRSENVNGEVSSEPAPSPQ